MRQGILCTILGIFLLKPVVCWLNKEKYQAFTPWLTPCMTSCILLLSSQPSSSLSPFISCPSPFLYSTPSSLPISPSSLLLHISGNSSIYGEFPGEFPGIPNDSMGNSSIYGNSWGIPGNSQCYQIITCLFAMHDYFLIIICKQTA